MSSTEEFDFESMTFPTQPTADFEDVTPEMAAMWLLLNLRNRVISDGLVDEHVRTILADLYKTNGESIKFSVAVDLGNGVKRPVLLDGQHRLTALVKAGKTVRMLVVRGLELDTQATIDVGRKRSAADNLRMQGRADYVTVAAVGAAVWKLDRGDRMLLSRPRATNQEVLATLDQYPEIQRSVEVAGQVHHAFPPLNRTSIAVAHHLIRQVDPDQEYAPYFFELIKTGANLQAGHPVLVLHRRIVSYRINKERMPLPRGTGMIIKAWNACVENRSVGNIIQPMNAAIPEVAHPSAEYLPLLEAAKAAHG